MNDDVTREELELFLQEADEQLQLLDDDFVFMEKEGPTGEILQEVFRAAHTLKGSSAMIGYDEMSAVAHAMETVLDRLRSGTLVSSPSVMDTLFRSLDTLRSLKQGIQNDQPGDHNMEALLIELDSLDDKPGTRFEPDPEVSLNIHLPDLAAQAAQELGTDVFSLRVCIDPDSNWVAVRCFQVINEVAHMGDILKSRPEPEAVEQGEGAYEIEIVVRSQCEASTIRSNVEALPEIVAVDINRFDGLGSAWEAGLGKPAVTKTAASSPKKDISPKSRKPTQLRPTIRVDVGILDRLMNLVGEMVIDRNRIGRIGKILQSKYEEDEEVKSLGETSAHIMRVVNELQDNILKARMLPIATVFNGFPRLVRDLAHKEGKKVEIILSGQETELDRTIMEQIRDPLLHLIRNAIDHGIELPEERKAASKPETGIVRLSARQEQNQIVITMEDDGAGIDLEKVKNAAVSKGLISKEEAAIMSGSDAMKLVFASGLSTAASVTDVSGRGVGMNVVSTNVKTVGGSILADTRLGFGTKFTVRLPLTVATINGLMVSVKEVTYAIPMASVLEVCRVDRDGIHTALGKEVIQRRDDILPLLRLDRVFGFDGNGRQGSTDDVVVVIVMAGGNAVGLAVDAVMEPQEIVVKSLGGFFGDVHGVAGATILGDGRVALILDTPSLAGQASRC